MILVIINCLRITETQSGWDLNVSPKGTGRLGWFHVQAPFQCIKVKLIIFTKKRRIETRNRDARS